MAADQRIDIDLVAFGAAVVASLLDTNVYQLPLLELLIILDQAEGHWVKAAHASFVGDAGNARGFDVLGAWRWVGFGQDENAFNP